MLSQNGRPLLRLMVISTALLFLHVASAWAGSSDKEICDVDADYSLGLEDYPAAIRAHLALLRTHEDSALAHYHLGFAYSMVGRSEDELDEYRKAAKLGLRQWDLYLNLGLAYLSRSDLPKAVDALAIAVRLGPDHYETHFNLAIAYRDGHSLREAFKEITLALKLAPQDLDAGNTKAIICAELGNLSCARDEWTHLDSQPQPFLACLGRGSRIFQLMRPPSLRRMLRSQTNNLCERKAGTSTIVTGQC